MITMTSIYTIHIIIKERTQHLLAEKTLHDFWINLAHILKSNLTYNGLVQI